MTEWTLMLKTPNGIQFHLVEADVVDWDDEREFLVFMDLKAGVDAVRILENLLASSKAGNLSPEDATALIKKLLSTGGRIVVARFDRGAVLGYFKGRRDTLEVNIQRKDSDFPGLV